MSDIAEGFSHAPADADAARRVRVETRLSTSAFLAEPLRRLGYDSREMWAWDNYKTTVMGFIRHCRENGRVGPDGRVRMLEIGGGRGPLLTPDEADSAGVRLTVNDIDARELAMASDRFDKACFDVSAGFDPQWAGSFDLLVSKMVFEHVKGAPKAWTNARALLAPGGVAMAFHPVLYAPPFVVNWLMPETLTARVLRYFFPDRHDGDYPKFPARYEMCFAMPSKVAPILADCGFSETLIAPFFGHRYFRHLPGLRNADAAFSALAERNDWRAFCSYAFTLARR